MASLVSCGKDKSSSDDSDDSSDPIASIATGEQPTSQSPASSGVQTCANTEKLDVTSQTCVPKQAADWLVAADCKRHGYFWYDIKDVAAKTVAAFDALKPTCRASAWDACPVSGNLPWAKAQSGLVTNDVASTQITKNSAQVGQIYSTLRCFVSMNDLSIRDNGLTSFDGHLLPNVKNISLSSNSNLASVDVTRNSKLEYLDVASTKIAALDLSKNKLLIDLFASFTKLAKLNLTTLPNLQSLSLYGVSTLSQLDLSKNTKLSSIEVTGTSLTSLDLSKADAMYSIGIGDTTINPSTIGADLSRLQILNFQNLGLTTLPFILPTTLQSLNLSGNLLDSVDVSSLVDLYSLDVSNMGLEVLDVASNTELMYLFAGRNALESLDLSSNSKIIMLLLENNKLTYDWNGTSGSKFDLSSLAKLRNLSIYGNSDFSLHFGSDTFHSDYLTGSQSTLDIDLATWSAATGTKPSWTGTNYGLYYHYVK